MHSTFDERLGLAWLVKARIIILTFLLGIELAIAQLTPTTLPLRLFVVTIVFWYAVSVFYWLISSVWQEHQLQAALQIVTDLILTTVIVHATGGIDSSLNFLYPLVIIVGSVLLPRVWAYLVAALAFVAYGAILELSYFGLIPSYSTTHPEIRTLQGIILINLIAFIAVAYLAGLLASKLRQADVQLKDTSGALQNLQVLHENVIQSISSGLITTGLDGHITLANTAALRLLGKREGELLGAQVHTLFLDPLPQVGPERAHGEVRAIGQSGYRKTFRVIVSALEMRDGETSGYVYSFDDLTEIRRLEREVRLQDRLAAVGRLAAAIAHEIRNPLTSIAGSASMLSEIPDLSEEQKQLLQIVTRESERLNDIITEFLAYSRSKQYQFRRVDLIPLLEDTLTLLNSRLITQNTGISIRKNFETDSAWALADGDKIRQVFWNFYENAIRAMREGGLLTVSVKAVDQDWEIGFADTGPGIPPQLVEKIFEPFQSQFEGGTGLGLAVVYQIAQAHEGKVWARSKPGSGSEFVLRLRRFAQEETTASETETQLVAASAAGGARG